MINNRKKVFISYSWVPEENKQWVEKLAKKLENDGIEVVIDYKNLKLGHESGTAHTLHYQSYFNQ